MRSFRSRLIPAMAIAAFALGPSVHAAADDSPRWQLGASVETNSFEGVSGVELGIPYDFSGETSGWRLSGAVHVWGPLWAEASWREYGGFDGQAAFCDTQPSPTTCEAVPIRFEASGRSLAVRAERMLIGGLSGFLRYGRNWLDTSIAYAASTYAPAFTGSNSDSGKVLGAGLAWNFADRWSVFAALERTDGLEPFGPTLDESSVIGLRVAF